MLRLSPALRLAAPLLACACSHGSPAPAPSPAPAGPATRTDPDAVHVEGRTFRDGRGRQLLFRGYNAKVDGIFDATFDDGRAPNEVFTSFDEPGAARFEELGFNALRLPTNWSALEPHPLAYSEAFFARVSRVLDLARQHHFYVLLDMHQDAYSKEIGEDGQPLWAIVPPPTMLLHGPSDDSRRTSTQVVEAGFSFFADAPATDGRPLQDAFGAAVVDRMIERFVGNPQVLALEAFNEPVVLLVDELHSFHEGLADRLHAVDQDAPLFFEPIGLRNQLDEAEIAGAPFAHGPGVYAPHIYTGWFSRPDQHGWASQDPKALAPSMLGAEAEAASWGTPLFVTEFGCDQSVVQGSKWLSAELDLQDQVLASSTAWAWESGSWGITDGEGKLWPKTVPVVSRSFPRAVAGDLVAIERPAPGHLRVRYRQTAQTRGLEHEVSVSSYHVKSYQVLCDGLKVAVTAAPGRASFVCPPGTGEQTFDVIGVPVD